MCNNSLCYILEALDIATSLVLAVVSRSINNHVCIALMYIVYVCQINETSDNDTV